MKERLIEHVFFFAIFGMVGYLVWKIVSPFVSALALAAIIATVCHPLFERVLRTVPRKNRSLAAFLTVLVIACTIFIPLIVLCYILFIEAATFYDTLNRGGGLSSAISTLEHNVQSLFPNISLDLAEYARNGASWLASHTGAIFAGTASTLLLLFLMLVGMYYMFKDGPDLVRRAVRVSPLPDEQDEHILARLSLSIRSVVLGTLAVALIQGVATAIGFFTFGMSQPVLWGSVAAVGALIPGVGTSFVFIGGIIVALLNGMYGTAIGLAVWGACGVGLIDNFLGPYLMSRGVKLHPFAVLLAVLGGVALFGPVGFLVGPVTLSFFMVLFDLYSLHVKETTGHT